MNKRIINIIFLLFLGIMSFSYEVKEYIPHMKKDLISPWFEHDTGNTRVGNMTSFSDVLGYKKLILRNMYNIDTRRYNMRFDYTLNNYRYGSLDINGNILDFKNSYLGSDVYTENSYFESSLTRRTGYYSYMKYTLFYRNIDRIDGIFPIYTGIIYGVRSLWRYSRGIRNENSPFLWDGFRSFLIALSEEKAEDSYGAGEVGYTKILKGGEKDNIRFSCSYKNLRSMRKNYANLLLRAEDISIRGFGTEIYADQAIRYSMDYSLLLFREDDLKIFHSYGLKIFGTLFYDYARFDLDGLSQDYDTRGIGLNFWSVFLGKIPVSINLYFVRNEREQSEHFSTFNIHISL